MTIEKYRYPLISPQEMYNLGARFVCFREHRGGLDEAMQTVKYFKTVDDMLDYVEKLCREIMIVEEPEITLGSEHIWDERVSWNTVYVLNRGSVFGMADITTYIK